MEPMSFHQRWLTALFMKIKPRRRRWDQSEYGPPPDALDFLGRLPLTRPSSPKIICGKDPGSKPQTFLEIIPPEIRQHIWEGVLGGHTFHLEIREKLLNNEYSKRLAAKYCMSPDPRTCNHTQGSGGCRAGVSEITPPRLPKEVGELLSLLVTCRQIYTEAIDFLYSSNTFVTLDPRVLKWLPITLLPQRIDAIRSLRFIWLLSNGPPVGIPPGFAGPQYQELARYQDRWREIWYIISTMKSLQSLYVKLEVSTDWATLNKESAEILLEPIKQITRPKIFVLSLPFPAMKEGMAPVTRWFWAARNGWEGADPWDELHCTIQRTENI